MNITTCRIHGLQEGIGQCPICAKPNIVLVDDGTLDTVLRCVECNEEFRFNFQSAHEGIEGELPERAYDDWVKQMIRETRHEHECPMLPKLRNAQGQFVKRI